MGETPVVVEIIIVMVKPEWVLKQTEGAAVATDGWSFLETNLIGGNTYKT